MNEFKLLYKNKVVISKGDSICDDKYIATIISNIASLGYTLSSELIDVLRTNSTDYVINFYKDLVVNIKEEIGFKEYNPMYPNFPKQVAELDDYQLFLDAIIHYLNKGEKLPYYDKNERFPLVDEVEYKVLELGTFEDYKANFINILNSKTSISDRNKEYMVWFMNFHFDSAVKCIPEVIPFKENMCMIVSMLYDHNVDAHIISKYVKTATDVLRIITFMSGGDITLAENCRFRSFTRRKRKFILSLLENIPNKLEDMYRYKNKWIKAGERIHPGDFAGKYSSTYEAFTILREKGKVETFSGKVEKLIKDRELIELIDLLKSRPGELARRLNEILSINDDKETVTYLIDTFEEIAEDVESTVLWQVREFFKHRNSQDENMIRAFFPKGSTERMYVKENDLKPINKEVCNTIVELCENALIEKYSKKEKLGNVYIAPELNKYIIPFNQRTASKSLKTITRGSRVSIDKDTSVIRAFIHWKDSERDKRDCWGTDIDLTAVIMADDFSNITDISYYNLKEVKLKCYHSGDVRCAPEGGSEFVDINIDSLLDNDARYVAFVVNSYSKENFIDVPECFFGFMERKEINSGEIYEPKTVKNKFDLTSESTMALTMIFDLLEREFIWIDSTFKPNGKMPNNVYNNIKGVEAFAKVMVDLHKPNMYDLFTINAKARGNIVDDIEEADVAFVLEKTKEEAEQEAKIESKEEGQQQESCIEAGIKSKDNAHETICDKENGRIEITPYDIEEIVGDFL